MQKTKAVALFSGGLDSILAVKIMLDMRVNVFPISFITPFSIPQKGCIKDVQKVCNRFGIPLKIQTFMNEYKELVKEPQYGYGKNMNPCIDCRILMLKEAKKYMQEINAQFIITGEVLGERPMTQNKRAMMIIESASELNGKILRPLSAKLLKPTIPERNAWVNRDKLFAFEGRSRKPQMKLAEELDISDYPTPAGGCLLTDPTFARKIRDGLKYNEDSLKEITLLRYGRHFRLPDGAKVVVGRNEKENGIVLALMGSHDICLETDNVVGPTTLLHNSKEKKDIETAASICLRYSDWDKEEGRVLYWHKDSPKKTVSVKKISRKELESIRV